MDDASTANADGADVDQTAGVKPWREVWQIELQFTAVTEAGREILDAVMLQDFERDGWWNAGWNGRSGRLPVADIDFVMPVLVWPDLAVVWPDGIVSPIAD